MLKRYEEALIACDQALQIDSNIAEAYYIKGYVLKYLGKEREAKQAYNRAKLLGYKR